MKSNYFSSNKKLIKKEENH